jgi:hypothetical protein
MVAHTTSFNYFADSPTTRMAFCCKLSICCRKNGVSKGDDVSTEGLEPLMTDDEKNQLHKHKENVKPPTTVETKKDGNFPSGSTVGDIAPNKPVTVIPDYSGLVPDLLKKTSSVPVERRSSVSSVNSDYSD